MEKNSCSWDRSAGLNWSWCIRKWEIIWRKSCDSGLIDCHTHLDLWSSRGTWICEKLARCFLPRHQGGDSDTVEERHGSFFWNLCEQSSTALDYMLRHGVILFEAKSGYGLDWGKRKPVEWLDRDHEIDLDRRRPTHSIEPGPVPRIFRSHCGANASKVAEGYLLWKGVFTNESRYLLSS